MEPILKTIAREYAQRYPNLKQLCFLFPNKRCGLFLKKYLAEYDVLSEDMPHVLTVTEFTSQVARLTEASRIVQLFTLFNAYKDILGGETKDPKEPEIDFDAFRGWGETVLSDFNTVDFYLSDPEEIFKNVKDYREIATDFLTDEQKEVMSEYFGIQDFGDSSSFWKSFGSFDNLSPLKEKFLNLWQVLAPLHKRFISALQEKGLGTAGSIYRRAAERLEEKGKSILPYYKVIAVGFNALTESERTIFKSLQKMAGTPGYDDYADFIWDATGPILNNPDFTASRFVAYNKKHFPSPEWVLPALEEQEITTYPDIKIISAPSLTAQAKVAAEVLKDFTTPEKRRMIADAEVGLVLPDESLLSNALYSIPDNLGDINLTMGVSLKQAPISSFVNLLRRLYATTRQSSSNVFYSKDLRMLFTHPYSYILFLPSEIESLLGYLSQFHKGHISLEELSEIIPDAASLLNFPSKKKGDTEIFDFLYRIFDRLESKISQRETPPEESEDIAHIKIYREYVEALQEAITQFGIQSSPLSLMQMTERLVAAEKIGFEGEPLSGLQVMGTLETRSLDFRDVIILSMNEGVMPRKALSSSFIPETLRKAYGLPPARYAEEIFGYYFYRLISRAENVWLIYDGRANTGRNGGESRYLLQLKNFAPKDIIKEETWQYRLESRPTADATVEKTPEIAELALAYCSTGEDRKNFSASSLNTYRECQVKFFLQNLLNINSDPEKGDFMDPISIGDVLHHVMMELYLPDPKDRGKLLEKPKEITASHLEKILASPEMIGDLVNRNILEIYYGYKEKEPKEIESGVIEIIAGQISELVASIVRYDLTLTPFRLYGCEIDEKMRVKMESGRTVNFRFAIDRLDEVEIDGTRQLRIIDYKTGKRKRKAGSLEEVFDGKGGQQIFQLFTYAWLLDRLGIKGSEEVVTEIYFVPDLLKGERGLPEINKEKVKSFAPYREEFGQRMENLVESIFTDPLFKECSRPENCGYCPFKNYCRK